MKRKDEAFSWVVVEEEGLHRLTEQVGSNFGDGESIYRDQVENLSDGSLVVGSVDGDRLLRVPLGRLILFGGDDIGSSFERVQSPRGSEGFGRSSRISSSESLRKKISSQVPKELEKGEERGESNLGEDLCDNDRSQPDADPSSEPKSVSVRDGGNYLQRKEERKGGSEKRRWVSSRLGFKQRTGRRTCPKNLDR